MTSTESMSVFSRATTFLFAFLLIFMTGNDVFAQQNNVNLFDSLEQPTHRDAPVLRGASATDDQWINQWNNPGFDLYGTSMVEVNGDIYIGGIFFQAAGIQVNSIVKWDPVTGTFSPLGSGITESGNIAVIYDMVASGNDIYVAGSFDTAGGVAANNIAVYNTTSGTWSALGTGTDNDVQALAINGSNVFAGGRFNDAGGIAVSNIAMWNGSSWSALGTGTDDDVLALEVYNNELYAGGYFDTAGGVTATRIARWDGTAWSAVSNGVDEGVNSTVSALEVGGSDLYIGGAFTEAAGVAGFNKIARWSASTSSFSTVGTGFDDAVLSLEYDGTTLRAGGLFEQSGINTVNFIAEFDGTVWHDLDGGVWSHPFSGVGVQATLTVGSDTYVTGYFAGVGPSTPVTGIAIYDNSSSAWESLGDGFGNALSGTSAIPIVRTIATSGDLVVVGGTGLEYAGNVHIRGIGIWNESTKTWSEIGGITRAGETGNVNDIVISGDIIYVGGYFDTAGGVAAENIAMYNLGTGVWSPVGTGVDGTVNDLLVNGSALYAAGFFSNAGGNAADRIAVWNGSAWSALGTGLNGTAYAMALYNNEIYAGGSFSTAGGSTASAIAKWDGVTWSPLMDGLDEGISGTVYALAVAGDSLLYVAGDFGTAGSSSANNIATWNNSSSSFAPMGTGFDEIVQAVAVGADDQVYAGGAFTMSGLATAPGAAVWNGSTWDGLGSGVNYQEIGGGILAIQSSSNGNDLYFGGAFSLAGTKATNGLARYNMAPTTSVDEDGMPNSASSLVAENYPNPFSGATTIDVSLDKAGTVSVSVFDILGRRVATVAEDAPVNAGSNRFQFDGSNLKSGVYFYRVETDGRSATGLMTLVR